MNLTDVPDVNHSAGVELLSPIPYAPHSLRQIRGKVAWALLFLLAAPLLSYCCATVLAAMNVAPALLAVGHLIAFVLLVMGIAWLCQFLPHWQMAKRAATVSPSAISHSIPRRRPQRHRFRQRLTSPLDFPLMLLLLGTVPVVIASGFYQLMVFWLPLAFSQFISGCRKEVWLRWHGGYDPAGDCFYLERSFYWGKCEWREEVGAGHFCGIYWERGVGECHLWLASVDGDSDIAIPAGNSWYGSNGAVAQRLAERLSAASGLPLLYRWPAPPLSMLRSSGAIR